MIFSLNDKSLWLNDSSFRPQDSNCFAFNRLLLCSFISPLFFFFKVAVRVFFCGPLPPLPLQEQMHILRVEQRGVNPLDAPAVAALAESEAAIMTRITEKKVQMAVRWRRRACCLQFCFVLFFLLLLTGAVDRRCCPVLLPMQKVHSFFFQALAAQPHETISAHFFSIGFFSCKSSCDGGPKFWRCFTGDLMV